MFIISMDFLCKNKIYYYYYYMQYRTISQTRQVVERAFGMYKQRFRHLKLGVEMRNIDKINDLILAYCTLYNLCLVGDCDQDFTDDLDDNFDPFDRLPSHTHLYIQETTMGHNIKMLF